MSFVIVFVLIVVLVAAGLAFKLSSESKDYDDRDRQGWWPGSSR
jgi:hypothetical protein